MGPGDGLHAKIGQSVSSAHVLGSDHLHRQPKQSIQQGYQVSLRLTPQMPSLF